MQKKKLLDAISQYQKELTRVQKKTESLLLEEHRLRTKIMHLIIREERLKHS